MSAVDLDFERPQDQESGDCLGRLALGQVVERTSHLSDAVTDHDDRLDQLEAWLREPWYRRLFTVGRPMPETEPFWQQLISDNFSGVVAVAIALITLVGTNVSYKVRRHFEKQKETREYREAAIARWRAETDKQEWWIDTSFQDTAVYSEMKPYLSESVWQQIEHGRGALTVDPRPGVLHEGESHKQRLLNEITRIEREEWKLL